MGGDESVDQVVLELGLGDDGAQEYTRKGMEVTAWSRSSWNHDEMQPESCGTPARFRRG